MKKFLIHGIIAGVLTAAAGIGGAAFGIIMNIFLFFANKESYESILKFK